MTSTQNTLRSLQVLQAECKRKFPAVHEAAEAAMEYLESPASRSVRLFRHEIVIRPFLLALNHRDVPFRVAVSALSALQSQLMQKQVHEGEFGNILRVLRVQARSGRARARALSVSAGPPHPRAGRHCSQCVGEELVRIKVLQTVPLVLTAADRDAQYTLVPEALLVCSMLLQDKAQRESVVQTAIATVRQVIMELVSRSVAAALPASIEHDPMLLAAPDAHTRAAPAHRQLAEVSEGPRLGLMALVVRPCARAAGGQGMAPSASPARRPP